MQREDIEQKIVLKYETNADETSKEVNDLSTNIDKTANSTDTVTKSQNNLKKSMAASTDEVVKNGGAMGILNNLTNGYAQNVKDAWEAMVLFSKESKIGAAVQKAYTFVMGASTGAMKAFKVALISTGIGAIALALIMLIVNFGKVKDAVYNLIPGLKSVGEFFGKMIDAVTDFIGVTSEAERTLDKLNKATQKMLSDNKDLLANFGDQLSDFQKKQVEIASSLAERIKEINDNEALSIEEKNNQIRLAQERAKRDLLKNIDDTNSEVQKKRDEAAKKEKDDAARLYKEKYDEEAARIKASNDLKAQLAKEEEDRVKAGNIAIAELEAEKEQAQFEKDDLIVQNKGKKIAEDKVISEAMLQQERDIMQAKLNIAQQGIQLIASVFGKSKAVQKAAIIAENAVGIGKMIIANNLANIGALATPQAIATSGAAAVPVIAMNNISTGIGVASSIAATVKALSSLGGGGAGSGASNSGGSRASSGASATPQVNFQASKENQIGNTMAGKLNEQAPIRVTVLENDITKVQAGVQAKVVSNSF